MPGSKSDLVIVDSDALIGLLNPADSNHSRYLEISEYLSKNSLETVVPYPIILEAATALSRNTKINRPDLALQLLENYAKTEDKPKLDEEVALLTSQSFKKTTSRKNTPFDHYLLALAKKNGIRYIFSFDTFYKSRGLIPADNLLKK